MPTITLTSIDTLVRKALNGLSGAPIRAPAGRTAAGSRPPTSGPSRGEGIVSFARGTMIATPRGASAVEELAAGDKVLTRDVGPRPIRWIGSRLVRAEGGLAPVVIRAGALDNHRDIMVSQAHRMLVTGWRAELLFGEPEVLVAAGDLVDGEAICLAEGGDVEYFHVLLDRHEIVTANGAATESFHPGEQGMGWMDEAAREGILALFPQLRASRDGFGPCARPSLRGYEARALCR